MTYERLTDSLAERIIGWRARTDRYLKSGREWLPKGRFRPLANIDNALQLLGHKAELFALGREADVSFTAEVHIDGHTGRASDVVTPRGYWNSHRRGVWHRG